MCNAPQIPMASRIFAGDGNDLSLWIKINGESDAKRFQTGEVA